MKNNKQIQAEIETILTTFDFTAEQQILNLCSLILQITNYNYCEKATYRRFIWFGQIRTNYLFHSMVYYVSLNWGNTIFINCGSIQERLEIPQELTEKLVELFENWENKQFDNMMEERAKLHDKKPLKDLNEDEIYDLCLMVYGSPEPQGSHIKNEKIFFKEYFFINKNYFISFFGDAILMSRGFVYTDSEGIQHGVTEEAHAQKISPTLAERLVKIFENEQ